MAQVIGMWRMEIWITKIALGWEAWTAQVVTSSIVLGALSAEPTTTAIFFKSNPKPSQADYVLS